LSKGDLVALLLTTLEGGEIKVDDDDLEELRAGIRGDVLTEADAESAANPIYNAMHNRRPALKVRATGTADVVDAVNFARERNVLVAVRGGGHSVAGLSSCDGGLVIDLTRMRAVTVDPDARRASVQGGALWGDVDRETQLFGLVVPGGVVSETGVGGLTLGGGEGWVRRKYGLTIDSLRSATVVTADGSVHLASADHEPDLFWAIRGGGGNFGVVTHFEFDAHPLGPVVAFAGVFYSSRDAGDILRRWRDHVSDAPEEVTSVAVAISMPADPALPEPIHNQSCLVIGGVYAGDVDEGMRVLQPLRELGTPLADISEPTPFVGVNSAFDPFFPMGTYQSYWKAQNLDTLPDEALAIIAEKADSRPSATTLAVVFHMGGAINRVGTSDTAYGERTAQWMSSFDGNWEDPNDNAANIAWVRDAFDRVAKYGKSSTYTNFTGQADETTEALARNAYGPNTARLRSIKRQYDHGNFFRINPNISPA
jgi:FAD/FMN-containing dehydrogenase